MASVLSKHAARCLRAAGWFPGGTTDVRASVELLEENEFRVSQPARDFLQEFGELVVTGWRRETISWTERLIRLAIQRRVPKECGFRTGVLSLSAGRKLVVPWIDRYQKVLCEPCLVGECEDGHADLLITPAGELFGVRMESVWPLGRDRIEALNRLCDGTAAGPTISVEREEAIRWGFE